MVMVALSDPFWTLEASDGSDPAGWFVVGARAGVAGWWDSPSVRRDTTARPLAHGTFPARGFRGGRGIGLTLGFQGGSRAEMEQARRDVIALLADDGSAEVPAGMLTVTTSTESLSAAVQSAGQTLTREVSDVALVAQVELFAPDPLRYSAPTITTSPLPERIGGLEWPAFGLQDGAATGYLEWGPRGDTGRRVLSNPGTADSAPTARVTGPLPLGFSLTRVDTGQVVTYSGALAAGEFVDVDFRRRRVYLGGTTDRTGLLSSRQWWTVTRGSDVEVAFTAPSYDATASVEWSIRGAWW